MSSMAINFSHKFNIHKLHIHRKLDAFETDGMANVWLVARIKANGMIFSFQQIASRLYLLSYQF